MTLKELGFAASTIWVDPRGDPRHLHAGGLRVPRGGPDADEERRPHRGEERAHPRDRVDRLLLRRVRHRVRRRRQRPRRRLGLLPVGRRAAHDRRGAVLVVQRDPGGGGLPVRGRVRGRLAGDRLGRDGGAHAAVGVLRLRRRRSRSSTRSSRTGSGARTAGCSRRGCRTSQARPSSTTRARSPASPGRSCSGRGSASTDRTGSRTRSRATTWRSRRSA